MPDSIGQSPQSSLQGQRTALSLITHKVYQCGDDTSAGTTDGELLKRYCTQLDRHYIQQRSSLSADFITTIKKQRAAYLQSISSCKLTKVTLKAASINDLKNNRFVYTMPLRLPDGTLLTDAQGKTLNDFVLISLVENNTATHYGLDPWYLTNPQVALCSLVTGALLSIDTLKPLAHSVAFNTDSLLDNYQQTYSALWPTTLTTLKKSQAVYRAKITAQNNATAPSNGASSSNSNQI